MRKQQIVKTTFWKLVQRKHNEIAQSKKKGLWLQVNFWKAIIFFALIDKSHQRKIEEDEKSDLQ